MRLYLMLHMIVTWVTSHLLTLLKGPSISTHRVEKPILEFKNWPVQTCQYCISLRTFNCRVTPLSDSSPSLVAGLFFLIPGVK